MSKNKTNFVHMFPDLVCRFCLSETSEESLEHLIGCVFVRHKVPQIISLSISDIYADDQVERQVNAVRIWIKVFDMLEPKAVSQEHLTVPHVLKYYYLHDMEKYID